MPAMPPGTVRPYDPRFYLTPGAIGPGMAMQRGLMPWMLNQPQAPAVAPVQPPQAPGVAGLPMLPGQELGGGGGVGQSPNPAADRTDFNGLSGALGINGQPGLSTMGNMAQGLMAGIGDMVNTGPYREATQDYGWSDDHAAAQAAAKENAMQAADFADRTGFGADQGSTGTGAGAPGEHDPGGGPSGMYRVGGVIPSDGDEDLEARRVTVHETEGVLRPEVMKMVGPGFVKAMNAGDLPAAHTMLGKAVKAMPKAKPKQGPAMGALAEIMARPSMNMRGMK